MILLSATFILCLKETKNFPIHRAVLLLCVLAQVFVGVLPELVLNLPPGYFSHLQFVNTGGRSGHLNIVSYNGFNFWSLLYFPMKVSSNNAIFLNISPKIYGLVFYSFFMTLLLSSLWYASFKFLKGPMLNFRCYIGTVNMAIALSNIGMMLILTGVHERFLYHFFPFLFVATFSLEGLWVRSRMKLFIFVSTLLAIAYGLYVLLFIINDNLKIDIYNPWLSRLLASIFMIYFVVLIYKWKQIFSWWRAINRIC